MAESRAVAATLASIIVFTSLLVANMVAYYGEGQKLGLLAAAHAEQQESFMGGILMAESAYSVLGSVQSRLVSDPATCTSWGAYASSLGSSSRRSGTVDGINYTVETDSRVALGAPSSSSDNLSLVSPFQGYRSGALNLEVRVSLAESMAGGTPSYARTETHYLHLPVSLSKALSVCLGFISELTDAGAGLCNASQLRSLFDSTRSAYSGLAGSEGLALSAASAVDGAGGGCPTLSYSVTVSEGSVRGVSGTFGWLLRDSGATRA